MNTLQRKTIVLDGLRVNYLEKGESSPAPVLLLHGFASGSYIWKVLVDRMNERFRILIPDLPGHGLSGLPQAEPTLDYYVRFVERFRISTGMNRFLGVGHSMGAAILAGYSINHSEKLNGMILESPPDERSRLPLFWRTIAIPHLGDFLMNFYPLTREVLKKRLMRGVHDPSLVSREMIEEAWTAFTKGPIKKWIPRAMRFSPLPVAWEKIPLSCKVVYGIQDRLVKPEFLRRLKEVLVSSEFHGFENCKHVPHLEYPENFAGLMMAS
jgi:pimeloyl-ACP methyl ester carboxylesterase